MNLRTYKSFGRDVSEIFACYAPCLQIKQAHKSTMSQNVHIMPDILRLGRYKQQSDQGMDIRMKFLVVCQASDLHDKELVSCLMSAAF